MLIYFDHETNDKLEELATRWGLSASTIAQTAIMYGLNFWLKELKQPSEEMISRMINRVSESDCTNFKYDVDRVPTEESD